MTYYYQTSSAFSDLKRPAFLWLPGFFSGPPSQAQQG
jgi:hypothetical protein